MKNKGTIPAKTSAFRKPLRAATLAGLVLCACGAQAGVLRDIYTGSLAGDPNMNITKLNQKAADQQVKTEELRYLPKVSIIARELYVYQDVRKSGSAVFKSGQSDYGDTRMTVELDQPIYDPTIKPQIEAAKARRQQALSHGRQATEWQTRLVVEGFIRSVRFYELGLSVDKVIARLEKEQEAVTKSYDAKVATLSDVQNVRLALASMRREKNNYTQQFYHELSMLGVSREAVKAGWVLRAPAVDAASLADVKTDGKMQSAEIEGLRAEVAETASQSETAKRRSWPVFSLYGAYDFDNAGDSVFGGPRDMSEYAVGLSVKWDIFSRGMNRSEARALAYKKEAKDAELKALMAQSEKAGTYGKEFLDQSDRSVAELTDLVKQYQGLQDSAARAYEAGKESYVNSITAYLAYESTARELTNAQYDRLMQQVTCCAQATGWNSTLVNKVDGFFVAAK